MPDCLAALDLHSNVGLLCQARDAVNWGGVRGTLGCTTGLVYYEARLVDEGLCRVGWSIKGGALFDCHASISNKTRNRQPKLLLH